MGIFPGKVLTTAVSASCIETGCELIRTSKAQKVQRVQKSSRTHHFPLVDGCGRREEEGYLDGVYLAKLEA